MNFGRLLTALVTPFNNNGTINYQLTTQLIEHLLENGTDGFVVNGTTGESPTLTSEEKAEFLQFVIKQVNHRVPVIAGTGSNNTQASIFMTQQAETLGADGVMLVTPYYNKPSQEGMFQHFRAIAQSTCLPVMLYNIPGRTVVKLDVDTILRLAEIDNIVAIKEATGDLDAISQVIASTADDFYIYSGDDDLLLPILSIGGHGAVSVTSHIAGDQMQDMISTYNRGDIKHANMIQQQLAPLIKALFIAPNPTAVKAALTLNGFNVGTVRLPLVPLNEVEYSIVKEALRMIKTKKVG
ncbi:4-hydroxy-tetrahydrodipicolinate synthase [Amphibacillus jilinensis]|uniref:4-hydroxy-tetrahydrodipicolinate synthase n=1 Tax=Amphibacillus jilinensis TaxID=1216008 RepID=UPI0002D433C6|nr:4-hydroxy-tetrahydrodipicolinate synthase [Amphibacillus jilinensis]